VLSLRGISVRGGTRLGDLRALRVAALRGALGVLAEGVFEKEGGVLGEGGLTVGGGRCVQWGGLAAAGGWAGRAWCGGHIVRSTYFGNHGEPVYTV